MQLSQAFAFAFILAAPGLVSPTLLNAQCQDQHQIGALSRLAIL